MAKIVALVLTIILWLLENKFKHDPTKERREELERFDRALAAGDTDTVAIMLAELDHLAGA